MVSFRVDSSGLGRVRVASCGGSCRLGSRGALLEVPASEGREIEVVHRGVLASAGREIVVGRPEVLAYVVRGTGDVRLVRWVGPWDDPLATARVSWVQGHMGSLVDLEVPCLLH